MKSNLAGDEQLVGHTDGGLPPPTPPPLLQSASVELIDHCAEYVAKHGQSFEGILKTRNFGQPGWEFLFADASAESTQYYRRRLEYEMEHLIHATADRAERMYSDIVASPDAVTSLESYPTFKHSLT